jgi:hypothetical protein
VPFVQNHFRGNVFGSAAKRPRLTSGLSIETQIKSVKKKKTEQKCPKKLKFSLPATFWRNRNRRV